MMKASLLYYPYKLENISTLLSPATTKACLLSQTLRREGLAIVEIISLFWRVGKSKAKRTISAS